MEQRQTLPVQHGAQNLGCHNNDASIRIDGNVTSHKPTLTKFLSELPELLIAEGLCKTCTQALMC